MDQALAQPTRDIAPRPITANLFELRNRTLAVTFSATSITGQPLLHYEDRSRNVHASGDEIRQVETEIGTFVTITLEPDADAGALLFTLLIPRVVLARGRGGQLITTEAIVTRSRLPPRLPVSLQLQKYEVLKLKGTASFVVS